MGYICDQIKFTNMTIEHLQFIVDSLNQVQFKGIDGAKNILNTVGAIDVFASKMKSAGYTNTDQLVEDALKWQFENTELEEG